MGQSDENRGNSAGEPRVCVRCKRMFTYLGFGHLYCPACKKRDAEYFQRVREFLYDNVGATATEVSDGTGVGINTITQYLREGRLEIPENSKIFLKCEMCATSIRSGRLCKECASKLNHAMRKNIDFDDEQIGEVPKKATGKMRFFEKE